MGKIEASRLTGQRIMAIRPMTKREQSGQGWEDDHHASALVIVTEDGTRFYPARDEEGNGPGVLFATTPEGVDYYLASELNKDAANFYAGVVAQDEARKEIVRRADNFTCGAMEQDHGEV